MNASVSATVSSVSPGPPNMKAHMTFIPSSEVSLAIWASWSWLKPLP